MAYDGFVIAFTVLLAYGLRFDFVWDNPYLKYSPLAILLCLGVFWGTYSFAHLYKKMWRYASIHELLTLAVATTLSLPVLYIFSHVVHTMAGSVVIPRSIFLIAYPFVLMGVGGGRLLRRIIPDVVRDASSNEAERVLIVGAGQAGAMVAKELRAHPDGKRIPIAFADDDPQKLGMEVLGLRVLGNRHSIPDLVREYRIDEIIIAIPSAPRREIQDIISVCRHCEAKLRILPDLKDILSGNSVIRMIRDVNLEDLLRREPVDLDLESIARSLAGKRVLVTGAGGSIGSELCRQLSGFKPERLILLGHGEHSIFTIYRELITSFPDVAVEPCIADVQDRQRIIQVMQNYQPHVVFHAAAHKHVPLLESNPSEAVKNNILGTINVADAAHLCGVERFVMISTDKAVNPTNVLGATKRAAEMYVQAMNDQSDTVFTSVRFGNVLGSRGSVVEIFQEQIQRGGPVTVTHPQMTRYFMTLNEAAQLVIQAGVAAQGGEVFLLDMGKPVRIVELAEDLIRLSGYEPGTDIPITFIGIRPGEKLHEEMLTAEEGAHVTKYDRIYVGECGTDVSLTKILNDIEGLKQILEDGEDLETQSVKIKLALQRLVPNYQIYFGEQEARAVETIPQVR